MRMYQPLNSAREEGFSLLEIILAVAVFTIFASAITVTVIQSFDSNRIGNEFSIATAFANEGIEATRSIKNQAYSNLLNTAGTGIAQVGGVWTFSGSNNTIAKYTRTIAIADVQRDGSGNIVASGGSIDSDTKKVSSTVTWAFNAGRPETMTLSSYLTNWRKSLSDGILVYSDSTSVAQPKARNYFNSTDSFDTQATTGTSFTDATVGRTFKISTSPTKQEAIAGYVNSSGVLRIMCYNGSSWTSDFTTTVGGTGADRRFGIAYENGTGDALVVYSNGIGTTNELGYRTKLGSTGCGAANWSANTNISTVRTTGIVQWIRMEASPVNASNTIAIVWADSNSDLSGREWTGASFGVAEPAAALETNLDRITTSQDVQSFDISIESLTGSLMVVWSQSGNNCTTNSNCIRYARYTAGWSASAAIPTVADRAANVDISSNPFTNEIALASLSKSSQDVSTAYWSGSAWTGRANVENTSGTPVAGSKLIANGWLVNGATTRYVILYMDKNGTGISWFVGNGSAVPVKQTDFTTTPAIGNPKKWVDMAQDPKNSDRLMLTVSDLNNDLFAKRLVMSSSGVFTWSNSDGGAALNANLSQPLPAPFSFAYWRNP